MRYLLLMMLASCSPLPQKTPPKTPWGILEARADSLDTNKITSLLGEPNEKILIQGKLNWIYNSSMTQQQVWAIGVREDSRVSGLGYFPEEDLTIADVESRWSSKKCEHKKEIVLIAGHHETEERTFICDEGRIRIRYNRYDEVEGIYIR